ncbi:MAG: short-chain dehydrogenase [Flavobacteriales bacterium]|jgi:dehydrogenase/reductase SDR family member 7B|nr:short-chain dehydrogenase [Flavobacteriales bacterium]|tara:strand:+ start:2273 stop:3091 length:819 start_codon:yes stop_codon:yes gene_type:complete
MNQMNGKVVWITGASSGIGLALAKAYSQKGAYLIVSARRLELLEELQSQLSEPKDCLVLPFDLQHHEQAAQWVEQALHFKGRIDVLVNNGGIGHLGSVDEMEFEIERKVMDVNFWAAVALTKAVLPHMLSNDSGQIWTISSILGFFGSPKLAAYAASKFAVIGYFESLQYELQHSQVHAGILSPGFINTAVSLNSLGPNGEPVGVNSSAQERGMLPEVLAQKFLQKTSKGRLPKHIVIGGYERFSIPFKRYLPRLFSLVYVKMTNFTRKNNA